MATRLTGKQRKFALEYVVCLNATEAAKRAGYGGNYQTLRAIGAENLAKPHIRACIQEILEQQTMPAKEVLARLSHQAMADMGDFVDVETGNLDLGKLTDIGHLVKKYKKTTTHRRGDVIETVEIELHDSQQALVHLGRAYALFTDKVKTEDWQSQVIEDIKAGRIAYDPLVKWFDEDTATKLFRMAGVDVASTT